MLIGPEQTGRLMGDPRSLRTESFPNPELVIKHVTRATQEAAISAALHIAEFTGGKPEISLEPSEKNRRTITIDTDADTAFKAALNRAPIQFHGIDAEGAKESAADKLGQAMPLAIGVFGNGEGKVTYVVDVVEGTTAAAYGRPDAISIVGLSTHEGITKIPVNPRTGKDVNYFRKLFAPAAFKDDVSLDRSARGNIEAIMQRAQIPADAITVAVMSRNCNETIIREAQEIGAKVELVSAGDLVWGLRAINSDPEHPIVMMGRGGAEEGSIAAVAARAIGATGQLRVIEEPNDIEVVDTTPIWAADDFVTGERQHSMVIFSAITNNTHFGLSPVKPQRKDSYLVESVVITSLGVRVESNKVTYSALK